MCIWVGLQVDKQIQNAQKYTFKYEGCKLRGFQESVNYDFIEIKCGDKWFQKDVSGKWVGSQEALGMAVREFMGRMIDEQSIRTAHNFLGLMSMLIVTPFISEGWRRVTDWESNFGGRIKENSSNLKNFVLWYLFYMLLMLNKQFQKFKK